MSSCDNPNADRDALMTRRQKFDGKTKICVKCKENIGNIVIRYAVYCKACFFPLIQTRFRKTLEPSINPHPDGPRRKALKAAGSLVIGFSGGTSSTTVLDLVAKTYFAPHSKADGLGQGATEEKLKGGREHPRNADKSVWKGKVAVGYVEVCGAFPEQKDMTAEIRSVVESYAGLPFEFIPLRLEDAFDPEWWVRVGGGLSESARSLGLNLTDEDLRLSQASSSLSPDYSPIIALRTYLSSLPTQTAFYSATQTLMRLLLLHTAASRRSSHLILGTSLTSLSINLISGIAQGAGFSVAEEAKEEWSPRSENSLIVRIVRPLRDIGVKECALWAWWCGLRIVETSRPLDGDKRHGIGSLTQNFIFGLETDYPATVSTIARTCAKLAPKEASNDICVLCGRPAQHNVQAWKARISIRSYHEAAFAVSENARPPHLSKEEIVKLTNRLSTNVTSTPSLTPLLCYACHTTLTSRSSRGTAPPLPPGQSATEVPLPMWVRSSVDAGGHRLRNHIGDEYEHDIALRTRLTEKEMKAEIEEFLFPDSE